jgi:hypothetical protein
MTVPQKSIVSKFEDGKVYFFAKCAEHWTTNIHDAVVFPSDDSAWANPILRNNMEARSHCLYFYPDNLDIASNDIKNEWLLDYEAKEY